MRANAATPRSIPAMGDAGKSRKTRFNLPQRETHPEHQLPGHIATVYWVKEWHSEPRPWHYS
jgi:hypothetical protein